jgi:hypothetical protein
MWEVILGCIVSSIISVLLSDKIIDGIQKALFQLGLSKNVDISGLWKADFEIGRGEKKKTYTEIIGLNNRLGVIWGHISPDSKNYYDLKLYMEKKPLRVKGSLADNRFFTGFWYHPIENCRFHGSYQLLIDRHLTHMEGLWIGYSESGKVIDCGKWIWNKIE